jgi:hypothetical protein
VFGIEFTRVNKDLYVPIDQSTSGEAGEVLTDAYRRSLATLGSATMTALPALMYGVAGIGLTLSDLAGLTGDTQLRAKALRSTPRMAIQWVPHAGRGAGR